MPGCSGEPVVTTSCAFSLCTRDCGCSAHPAFPAPSLLEGGCWHSSGVFTPRDRGGVCDLATSFCTLQRRSSSLPHLWGGWPAKGRSGGGPQSASSHRPHPGLRFAWPTLPTKGGGIRKSDLSPQAGRGEKRSSSPRTQGPVITIVYWSRSCQPPCQTASERSRDERIALTPESLLSQGRRTVRRIYRAPSPVPL